MRKLTADSCMIISPNLISAIARPLAGSPVQEGIGRVERQIDSSTYVIGLGQSRMTVQLTGGALSVGQRVNITERDRTVVIEQLGRRTPAGAATAGDSFLQSNAPAAAASTPPGCTVLLDNRIAEGFYTFDSSSDLFNFLGRSPATDPALATALDRLLAENGLVTVRTSRLEDNKTAAALLSPDDVSRELDALPSGFASRVFQSIPASVFKQFLVDRGSLSLDLMRALDGFAQALQLPASAARAGSAEAQQAALLQWLTAVSDARAPSRELSSLIPAFSAASLIDALRELANAATGFPEVIASLPQPERFGLTAETLAQSPDRSLLFNVIFKRLGLDFENTLATAGTADKGGLKPVLLGIAQAVEQALAGAAASDPAQRLRALVTEFEKAGASLVDTATARPAFPSVKTDSAAPQGPERARDTLVSDFRTLFQSRTGELRRQADMLLYGAAGRAESGTGNGRTAGLRQEAGTRFDTVAQRMNTVLQQLPDDLRSLIEQYRLSSWVRSDPNAAALLRTVEDALRLLEKMAADFSRKLEDFRSSLIKGQVSAAAGAFNRLPADRLEQPSKQTVSAGDGDGTVLISQSLRQSLETAMSRIESSQLLARPCPTAAGDQQIVALPVKVGNEWTEMHVRFVRRRAAKGGSSGPGRYTVYLNVAPSLLGAISCRIEYLQKKNSVVSLEFESPETKAWFAGRRNDLRKALLAIGLPSPHISFSLGDSPPKSGSETAQPQSNAIIDLKA